jgi:excinuclease ABC subunit A
MQRHQVAGHLVSVARYIGVSEYLRENVETARECPTCSGKGIVVRLLPERAVINPSKPVLTTGLHPILRPAITAIKANLGRYPEQIALDELKGKARATFLFGNGRSGGWLGLEQELLDAAQEGRLDISERDLHALFFDARACATCHGMGLVAPGVTLTENAMGFAQAFPMGSCWGAQITAGRLPLEKPIARLSLGQFQWARMLLKIRDAEPGSLVLLDEPCAGMCKEDVIGVVEMAKDLVRVHQCTVVMIEHTPLAVVHADHVLEFGPGGGSEGGRITFAGSRQEFLRGNSAFTSWARDLVAKKSPSAQIAKGAGLRVARINEYGLQKVELEVPLQKCTCIVGPVAAGKSGAIDATFRAMDKSSGAWVGRIGIGEADGRNKIRRPHLVDQKPIGLNPHSIPLTYIDAMTALRSFFSELAATAGVPFGVKHFSFNTVAGQCPACEGRGHVEKTLNGHAFWELCSDCGGARYREEVLAIKYRGKSIGQILQMTVRDARTLLGEVRLVASKLRFLEEVGLGYLMLGEPSNCLSGGEAQRVKIARQLSKRLGDRTLYLLDTPSRGLSLKDTGYMVDVFRKLAERNTVVIADNHPRFVSECDWLIALNSSGGKSRVEFAGAPSAAPQGLREAVTGLETLKSYLNEHRT